MKECVICSKRKASKALQVCVDCIRNARGDAISVVKNTHKRIRAEYSLPEEPPKEEGGISCEFCSNECKIKEGEKSYCGLKENVDEKLKSIVSKDHALLHAYVDPLPTNCCAAWFCPGSLRYGEVNIAVFFYGCNFDCVFCQNASHKYIRTAPVVSINRFVHDVKRKENAHCVCFFGGSPEPQLSFAIRASEMLTVNKKAKLRICWEWNGCGSRSLVKKVAEISFNSGGIVKFDFKAFDHGLSVALSGVPNKRAYENFEMIAKGFLEGSNPPVLTATTLLVPFYVDEKEVESIASFIANHSPNIPYSLLVFHPDFYMRDMPITPHEQVKRCYEAAKKYLRNVNIGNKHLLGMV